MLYFLVGLVSGDLYCVSVCFTVLGGSRHELCIASDVLAIMSSEADSAAFCRYSVKSGEILNHRSACCVCGSAPYAVWLHSNVFGSPSAEILLWWEADIRT
jgi:hypothetical protein